MKKRVVFFICLCLLSGPALARMSPSASADAAVLTAIVQMHCSNQAKHHMTAVEVLPDLSISVDAEMLPKQLDARAVQSLLSRNKHRRKLPHVTLCDSMQRVSGHRLDTIFATTLWKGFHRAFPGADDIFSLSLPGYSEDGKLAIVQGSVTCGGLCGSGLVWVLRYVHGAWVVVKEEPTWIS